MAYPNITLIRTVWQMVGSQKWKRKRYSRKWIEAMKAAKEAKLTGSTATPPVGCHLLSCESENEYPDAESSGDDYEGDFSQD